MLHIAICDDSKCDREEIEQLLTACLDEYGIEYAIELFPYGKSFLEQGMGIEKYSIIFLDMKMKGMDGIETAKRIRKVNPNVFIVIVTAFMQYSLDGYKVKATRYIMKNNLKDSMGDCMGDILKELKMQAVKIKFPFREGEREVIVHNILMIESKAHMLYFHMIKPKITMYRLREKLDNLELQLQSHDFLRIHKSYLVNMNYVEEVNSYKATLVNGVRLTITKERYPFVKNKILLFKGDKMG